MKVDHVKSYQENSTHNATSEQNNLALDDLWAKYKTVFENGLGKARGKGEH